MNSYNKDLFRMACKAIYEELHDKRKFITVIRQEGERFWLETHREETKIPTWWELIGYPFVAASVTVMLSILLLLLLSIGFLSSLI